jgi:hypothetical protein
VAEIPIVNIPIGQLLLAAGLLLSLWLTLASLTIAASRRGKKPTSRRHWLSRWLYVCYLGLVAVLALTAFGSLLRFGHVGGYPLLYHVTAAGGFVFLMVAIAFLYLPTAADELDEHDQPVAQWWAPRWSAWALIATSIATAGTMLLSMLPWLDTQGLRDMSLLHRYAGLGVVIAAILHAYSLFCVRIGWR